MRSLVVTRLSPFPPTAGVPLRVAANLAALAELGPVDVIIIGDEPAGDIPPYIANVETFGLARSSAVARLLGRFGPRHPLATSLHTPEVEAAIERLGSGPGLIVLDEVWMAPYLDAARRTGRDLIYDSHNVETVLRRQIASVGDVGLIRRVRRAMITAQVRRLERQIIGGTDQSWVCSKDDRTALHGLFGPTSDLHVVPNAADTSSIQAEIDRGLPIPPELTDTDKSIIFLGDLGYTPNEDGALFLLEDVMPEVERRTARATPVLVGRRPTDRLISAATAHGRTTVTGEVDSVLPYLAHGTLLTVTLRVGGGTRLKIVEAMAAGLPIVTTSKGLEGIDAIHGEHLLVADEPAAIAAAIARIVDDPEESARMADRARAFVEASYSWSAVAQLIAKATRRLSSVSG